MPKSGEHRVNTIDSFFRVRPSSKNLRDGESVSFLEDGKLIKQEKRNGVVYETKYSEQGKTETVSAGTTTTIIQGSSQSGDVTSVTAGTGLSGGGNSGPVTLNIDSTVVTLTGTQTLTNKTLTAPTLTGTAQGANLTLTGDLTVGGTTTTLNAQNLQVKDKNIVLNYLDGDSSSTADGAGITIQDGVNSSTDATILWDQNPGEFDFSHRIAAPSFIGDVTGDVTGNADTATALATARSITMSGEVSSGAVNFDGTAGVVIPNTTIGSGVIVNGSIASNAAIATSKLASNTISGVALGSNLNALTVGTGMAFATGSNYTGATARQITLNLSAIDHDSLGNFVANEHIDWTIDQGATNIHAGNYTDTNQLTTFVIQDGDTTNVTIDQGKYVKFQALNNGGLDIDWASSLGAGSSGDPYDLQFKIDLSNMGPLVDTLESGDNLLVYNADEGTALAPVSEIQEALSIPSASGTTDGVVTLNANGTLTGESELTYSGGLLDISGSLYSIIRLNETDVTNNPAWWTVADGGSYSIRLNNTGTYPLSITTNASNDAVDSITLGYSTSILGNLTLNDSLTIGSGGNYGAGSIYSDSNWGMLFRAKQASPSLAEFRWANSADSELMRIDTSGNLELPNDLQAIEFGVGRDGRIYSYNDDLYIVNQTAGQDIIFRNLKSDSSAYVDNLFIDGSAQRVGIGTTSPNTLLHLYSTSNTQLRLQTTGTGNASNVIYQNGSASYTVGINSAEQFSFYSSQLSDDAGFINTNGWLYWKNNILLTNNNTPLNGRDSGGTVRTMLKIDANDDLVIGDSNLNDVYINQNVGIGTSSPSSKTEISHVQNAESLLTLHNNRQDLGNVPIFGIAGKQSGTIVGKMSFYRGGQGNSGYITFSTKETNAASLTEKMRLDGVGNVAINQGNRFYFDGVAATGDTYIQSDTADNLRLVVGNRNMIEMIEDDSQDMVVIGNGITDVDFIVEDDAGVAVLTVDSSTSKTTLHSLDVTNALTAGSFEVTTLKVENIQYTDGDAAITIENGGGVSLANGLTVDSGAVGFNGGLDMNENNISNVAHLGVDKIFGDADLDTQINFDGNDVMTFDTGNAEAMRINASQNVGIGTVSPDEKLHIFGAAPFIKIENSAENSGGILFVDQQDEGQNASVRFDASARSLDFLVDSGEAMTISSGASGRNVGIGTTSPDQLLDLEADPPVLQLTNSRNSSWTSGDEIAQINFHSNDASGIGAHSVGFIKMITGSGSTSLGGEMTFGTGDYNTAATERMRIDEDGNVGIGTQSPAYKLDVNGTARFQGSVRFPDSIGATFGDSGDLQIFHNGSYGNITNGTGNLYIDNTTDNADMYFRVDDAGTLFTAMRIDGSEIGNVHLPNDGQNLYIGQNNDIRLVHLSGTNYMYTYNGPFYLGAVSTDQDVFIRGNDGGASINAVQFDMSDAGTAIFSHDIRIMDNSRYFMGTSNDFQMMHDGTNSAIENLTGALYITNHADDQDIIFRIDDGGTGASEIIRIDASTSNVGIGTSSPDSKLEVTGTTNSDLFSLEGAGSSFKLIGESGDATSINSMAYRLGLRYGSNDNGYIDFYRGPDGATGYLIFGASGAEKMRLDGAGRLGIGATSPAHKLDVSGTGRFTGVITASGGIFTNGSSLGYTSDGYSRASSGNNAVPGFSFASDTDTGMYRLGDDDLGFSAGGSLKYGILNGLNRFYSNVVVGPNNNNSKPYIQYKNGYDTASTPSYSWYYDNGCGMGHPAGSTIAFSTGSAERLRINNSGLSVSGDITINGNTTAQAGHFFSGHNESKYDKYRMYAGSSAYAIGMYSGNAFGGLNDWAMTFTFNNEDDRGFLWRDTAHSQGQGAMSLTTNGKLAVAHSTRIGYGETDNTTPGATYRLDVSGSIGATADVVAYISSDKRLKDNIKNIASPLEKLEKLNGVEFDWNDKQDLYQGHDIGVIAQEVEEVLPEIVDTRENGHKAVKYDRMVALLIEAVKEQQQQINELKEKLNV